MEAKPLPFQAGDPVAGDLFFDRKRLLNELKTCMLSLKAGSHQDFALVSPRRFGKSSVLETLKQELAGESLATVRIDCSDAYPFTLETILDAYAQEVFLAFRKAGGWRVQVDQLKAALKGAPGALAGVISKHVSKAGAEIGGIIGGWVELRERETDIRKLFAETVELPERLAEKTGTPCVVMLDEFQKLGEFNGKLLWAIRAKIQHHKRVISGSSVGLLAKTFADKESPFFNLFMVRTLEPFTDEDAQEMLEHRIKIIGMKFTDGAIEKIMSKTGNIPFNLQWLGLNCYLQALHINVKTIDEKTVELAYAFGIKNVPQFERDWARLTNRQQKILGKMAMYDLTSPEKIAASSQVRNVNVAKELVALVDEGYIKKVGRGEYRMIDGVFKDWIIARYGDRTFGVSA
jgi:AAA+ ATPase superfamily predicted ATPase